MLDDDVKHKLAAMTNAPGSEEFATINTTKNPHILQSGLAFVVVVNCDTRKFTRGEQEEEEKKNIHTHTHVYIQPASLFKEITMTSKRTMKPSSSKPNFLSKTTVKGNSRSPLRSITETMDLDKRGRHEKNVPQRGTSPVKTYEQIQQALSNIVDSCSQKGSEDQTQDDAAPKDPSENTEISPNTTSSNSLLEEVMDISGRKKSRSREKRKLVGTEDGHDETGQEGDQEYAENDSGAGNLLPSTKEDLITPSHAREAAARLTRSEQSQRSHHTFADSLVQHQQQQQQYNTQNDQLSKGGVPRTTPLVDPRPCPRPLAFTDGFKSYIAAKMKQNRAGAATTATTSLATTTTTPAAVHPLPLSHSTEQQHNIIIPPPNSSRVNQRRVISRSSANVKKRRQQQQPKENSFAEDTMAISDDERCVNGGSDDDDNNNNKEQRRPSCIFNPRDITETIEEPSSEEKEAAKMHLEKIMNKYRKGPEDKCGGEMYRLRVLQELQSEVMGLQRANKRKLRVFEAESKRVHKRMRMMNAVLDTLIETEKIVSTTSHLADNLLFETIVEDLVIDPESYAKVCLLLPYMKSMIDAHVFYFDLRHLPVERYANIPWSNFRNLRSISITWHVGLVRHLCTAKLAISELEIEFQKQSKANIPTKFMAKFAPETLDHIILINPRLSKRVDFSVCYASRYTIVNPIFINYVTAEEKDRCLLDIIKKLAAAIDNHLSNPDKKLRITLINSGCTQDIVGSLVRDVENLAEINIYSSAASQKAHAETMASEVTDVMDYCFAFKDEATNEMRYIAKNAECERRFARLYDIHRPVFT